MNGKDRQKLYRADLKRRGLIRESRFDEMMRAVGGTAVCLTCSIVRPAAEFAEHDSCSTCRASMGKLARERKPTVTAPSGNLPAGVVQVDASYDQAGGAGLAVVGALGEHHRRVEASSSTHAEVLALAWAMEIAEAANLRDLTFQTDCQAAWRARFNGKPSRGWTVEWISRRHNGRADALSRS